MIRNVLRFRRVALALLFMEAFTAVRAHDPFELTAKVQLAPTAIEVQITLAWSTARRLLERGDSSTPLPVAKFAEVRAEFEARAARFLVLTEGRRALVARKISVRLAPDEDVQVRFEFPRGERSPLRLDAILLRTLASDGYYLILTAYGPTPGAIAHEALSVEKTRCDLPPKKS